MRRRARRLAWLAALAGALASSGCHDAYIARCQRQPLRAGGVKLFAAHQMGSCRMGTDPQTSVAKPTGELHDVAGVWIADAIGMPSCSGVNPMVSTMALARRTATNMLDQG